jgi:hypothetical protein
MSSQTVAPEKLAAARDQVLASMRKRHVLAGRDAWMLVASGGVVLFIFGWFVAFSSMIAHSILSGWDNSWRMSAYFLLYLLVVAVWLVIQERRTRGAFFSFASSDVDLRRDPDNSAEYLINRSKTHLATLIEYGAWPGRALIAGVRGLLGIRETSLDTILPEAADVLTRMLALDAGVKIVELAPAGTDPMQLMPILKWLDTHDHIGFSTRGDKVWVSSPAKKQFAEDGVVLPKAGTVVSPTDVKSSGAPKIDEGPIELA